MDNDAQARGHRARQSEAFFGRRHGKTLRPFQTSFLENIMPDLLVDPFVAFTDLNDLFPGRPDKPFNLEIGFGGGEHLNAERLRLSDENFLGVEPFVNGMVKMLGAYDASPSSNIRLYNDDAMRILDWLPDNCASRIDLLYPDPWPKKKHWKRRFLSTHTVSHLARIIKPGGHFRFASDIDTYVNWTLQRVTAIDAFRWTANTSSDWHEPWPHWVRTRYEAKAVREGRRPGYFIFERLKG